MTDAHQVDLSHQFAAQPDVEIFLAQAIECRLFGFARNADHRIQVANRLKHRLDRLAVSNIDLHIASVSPSDQHFMFFRKVTAHPFANHPLPPMIKIFLLPLFCLSSGKSSLKF